MQDFDVLVVGGGPAGLQSAMMLARGGRSVLLCDDDRPRNIRAKEMHYFPTRDGQSPLEFRTLFKKDLALYPKVQIRSLTVQSVERIDFGFKAFFETEKPITFKKLILAVGVTDILPDIPGVAELWGKTVFHCPFCHGYEFKDKAVGIMGNGEVAYVMSGILSGITKNLRIFTNGKAEFSKEQEEHLRRRNIPVYEQTVKELKIQDGALSSVVLEGGAVMTCEGLLIRPAQKSKTDLGEKLGCKKNEMGLYVIDQMGMSSEKDIFIAGDVVDMRQAVLSATYTGMIAGVSAVHDLALEELRA